MTFIFVELLLFRGGGWAKPIKTEIPEPRIARRKDNELMLCDEKRSLHYYRVSIEVISRMEKDIWATSRDDALAQGNLEAKRGFQGWHMKQIIKRAKVSWFPSFWMDAPF